MKQVVTLLIALAPFFLFSQQYLVMGTDPSGDVTQPNIPDITEVAVKADQNQDSVWIRITSARKIVDDFGFEIVIDTNEVPDDGKYLGSQNPAGNESLSYDMKLEILNNAFFPPTHKILADTTGLLFTQDIDLSYSTDSFELTIRFQLHHIGSDGAFNLMVGGSSFDGIVRDNAPDSDYYSYNVANDTSSTGGDDSTNTAVEPSALMSSEIDLIPNPAINQVIVKSTANISKLKMVDMNGNSISIQYYTTPEGLQIDFGRVSSGIYLISGITEKGNRITKRLLIE
jgi:hypothetical protein